MFIELIDLLRCPREHEDSWLVAAFTKMRERFVIEGKLGCPVCESSYPIRNGIADLLGVGAESAPERNETVPASATSIDDIVRFAAMLGLTRPGSLVVMEGGAADVATALSEMTEARVITLNPTGQVTETERVAVVLAGDRIPLAAASVDGIVLGDQSQTSLAEAARALKPGGRIVAPVSTDLGSRFRELARDERHAVAESIGQLISLTR